MILSGEVEVLNAGPIEEEGADGDYGDNDYGDDDYAGSQGGMHPDDPMDDMRAAPLAQHLPLSKASDVNPFAHGVPQRAALQLQTILPRPATHGPHTPMVVQSPSNVSFENPAMAAMYDSHPHATNQMHAQFSGQYMQHINGHVQAVPDDKAAWSAAQMFGAQVAGVFTPTASAHGAQNGSPMNTSTSQQQAYLLNLQRQQLLQQQHHQRMTDDASPPSGAISVRRERSGSINSNGSGYGSPASNPGSYEMPSVMNAAAVPRRMAGPGGAGWDESMSMSISGMGMGMMKGGAISVGGGGNGHGYASMML